MSRMMLLLCLLAPLLTSCATPGQSNVPPLVADCVPETKVVTQTKLVDTYCDVELPIYVSKSDVLADETAQQILAHNKYGASKCGWKPKTK